MLDLRQLVQRLGFSPEKYVGLSPDLAGLKAGEALDHYLDHGIHEGRPLGLTTPAKDLVARVAGEPAADLLIRSAAYSRLAEANPASGNRETAAALLAFSGPLKPLIVIGDSHATSWLYRGVVDAGFIPVPLICYGGSARGLRNRRSQSGYGENIASFLADIIQLDPVDPVILFKFGQVDLEFVYTLKRLQSASDAFSPLDFLDFIEGCATSYVEFLRELLPSIPDTWTVVVQDCFPPSLDDASIRQGYTNGHISQLHGKAATIDLNRLQALDYPDATARTQYHAIFNTILDAALRPLAVKRLRDFRIYLGADGLIEPRCVAESHGSDHHMDFAHPAMAEVRAETCNLLWSVIRQTNPAGERPDQTPHAAGSRV